MRAKELKTNNSISDTDFKHALLSDVELTDGTTTQAIVIFNNKELNFEELNLGVNKGLENLYKVKSVLTKFCSIRNGKAKAVAHFTKKEFDFDKHNH